MNMVQPLKAVSRTQGNNVALKDGRVRPRGLNLAFEEVPVLVHAFRRMVREDAYDVCEMALTTYLCAKEHGARFTALPIFLVRGLHHQAIVTSARSPISDPKELEGRRVGVNRGWTVTTGVWARSILQEEHGVDLDQVTWLPSGDEHVSSYQLPQNVETGAVGADLPDLLLRGEIDAIVGMTSPHPEIIPLLADPAAAAVAALRDRSFYPINHLIVVRDELLDQDPTLGQRIFEAFATAKDHYLSQLRSGGISEPTKTDRMYAQVMEVTGRDPLPYGLEPNRTTLEQLVEHAVDQHILRRSVDVASVFAKGTGDLAG